MTWWVAVLLAAVSPFEAAMGRAVAHYNEAEWDAALRELTVAERYATGEAEQVAVWMHQGVMLANVPDAEAAKGKWRRALEAIPKAQLPLQVSPRVKALFEQVQQEVAARPVREAPKPVPLTPAPAQEVAGSPGVPLVPIISLAVAVAGAGIGMGLIISASSLLNAAKGADPVTAARLRADGSVQSTIAYIAFGLAGAAALTAVITFILME